MFTLTIPLAPSMTAAELTVKEWEAMPADERKEVAREAATAWRAYAAALRYLDGNVQGAARVTKLGGGARREDPPDVRQIVAVLGDLSYGFARLADDAEIEAGRWERRATAGTFSDSLPGHRDDVVTD